MRGSTTIGRCRYISTPEDRTQTRITRNRVQRTVALLLFLLIKEQDISIELGQNERRVVEYIKPVRQLPYDIQKHQVAFLSRAAEAFATERQILGDIRSAQGVDGRYGKEFQTIHGLAGSAKKWSTTRSLILRNSSSAKPENINSVYDHIVGKSTLLLIIQVGNTSNLILSFDLDSATRWTPSSRKCPSLCN